MVQLHRPTRPFGRCYSEKSGRAYIGTRPAKKSIAKVRRAISERTSLRRLLIDTQDQIVELNRHLTGWGNYFCLGPVSKAYRGIDAHVVMRLRRWLCKKHKTPGRGIARFPDEHLYQKLGLSVWRRLRATFRGRKRDVLSERRMREIRTYGATSGDWRRNHDVD